MARLDGKVVLITGGAGGIGSAIAGRLAEEGAAVAIADLALDRAEEVAAAIVAADGAAVAVAADATSDDDMRAAVATAEQRFGGLDVIFNNAGIAAPGPLEEISLDYFERVMRVNVYSVVVGTRAAVPALELRGGGKVINTCSVAGKTAFGGHTTYAASKFAVRGFTQGLAKELGAKKITVNAICPGMVRTPIWDEIAATMVADGEIADPGEAADAFAAGLGVVLGRGSVPDDLTGVAAFLASADSDYMTGQCLSVDGGLAFD